MAARRAVAENVIFWPTYYLYACTCTNSEERKPGGTRSHGTHMTAHTYMSVFAYYSVFARVGYNTQ